MEAAEDYASSFSRHLDRHSTLGKMDTTTGAVSIVLLWIGEIFAARAIAKSKNLSPGLWGGLSLLVGPLVLLVLLFIPRAKTMPGETKLCPQCQSEVPEAATVCRF